MIFSARSALEAKSVLIDVRAGAFPFRYLLNHPLTYGNRSVRSSPLGAVAARRALQATAQARVARRGNFVHPLAVVRQSDLRRRRRHAGCGAIDGAMGNQGPIDEGST